MTFVILAVALFASALVLMVRPVHGLVTYVAVGFLYPSYLTVSLGTVDINAQRIVIVVLFCRALIDRSLVTRLRATTLDVLVVGSFAVGLVALCLHGSVGRVLENRAGAFLDIILPYFVARLVIHDYQDLIRLAKGLAIIVIPVAALGVMESLTTWSPYSGLWQFSFFPSSAGGPELRFGLSRAAGAVGNAISFGLCFVVLLPMMLVLLGQRGTWRTVGLVAAGSAFAGALSSMSSGPFVTLAAFSGAAALIRAPRLVKPLVILVFLGCLVVELGSNRHVYHFVKYLGFNTETGWHRVRLIEVAIETLPEYWLLGYGFENPGWGRAFFNRRKTDVTNHYILLACRGGIGTTALFVGALGVALSRVRRVFKSSVTPGLRNASWYVGSMIVGLGVGMMSVGLLGAEGLFVMMLGVVGSVAFDVVPPSYYGPRLAASPARPVTLDVQVRSRTAKD